MFLSSFILLAPKVCADSSKANGIEVKAELMTLLEIAYDFTMYARIKPNILPVIKMSKFINQPSMLVNILVIPTANIRPGTA